MAGQPRRFQIQGTVVIDKVRISAQARQALQGLVININDKSLVKSLESASAKIDALRSGLVGLSNVPVGPALNRQLNTITKSVTRVNSEAKKTEGLFTQVLRKASAFRVSAIAINSTVDAIKNSFSALVKYDAYLQDINKILKAQKSELETVGRNILKLAARYNVAADEALAAFKQITQLGETGKEFKIFELALKVAASSTLDTAEAIDVLISVSKQAGISFDEAAIELGRLSALEDASAVDLKDLAEITTKAGTSIAQAFERISDGFALSAAIQERTKAGGAVVGTFIKTALSRIGGANKDVAKTFYELGISIQDANGKLRDPIEVLSDLKRALDAFGEQAQENIIGKIFGVRQVELGKAALDSLGNTVLKNGRTFELSKAATQSYATQILKIDEESKKFEARLRNLQNSLYDFLTTLSKVTVEPILNGFLKFSSVFQKVSESVGGLVTQLKVFGEGGVDLLGGFLRTAAGFGGAFISKQLFGLTEKRPNELDIIKRFPTAFTGGGNKGTSFGLSPTRDFVSNRPGQVPIPGQKRGYYLTINEAVFKDTNLESTLRTVTRSLLGPGSFSGAVGHRFIRGSSPEDLNNVVKTLEKVLPGSTFFQGGIRNVGANPLSASGLNRPLAERRQVTLNADRVVFGQTTSEKGIRGFVNRVFRKSPGIDENIQVFNPDTGKMEDKGRSRFGMTFGARGPSNRFIANRGTDVNTIRGINEVPFSQTITKTTDAFVLKLTAAGAYLKKDNFAKFAETIKKFNGQINASGQVIFSGINDLTAAKAELDKQVSQIPSSVVQRGKGGRFQRVPKGAAAFPADATPNIPGGFSTQRQVQFGQGRLFQFAPTQRPGLGLFGNLAKGISKVGVGLYKLDSALAPLTAKSFGVSFAFQTLGVALEKSGSQAIRTLGDFAQTIGNILPFGVKFAAVAVSLQAVVKVADSLVKFIPFIDRIVNKTSKQESEFGTAANKQEVLGQDSSFLRGAANAERLIRINKEAQFGKANTQELQELSRVADVFNNLIFDISQNVSVIEDEQKRLKATKEKVSRALSDIELISPGASQALLSKDTLGGLLSPAGLQKGFLSQLGNQDAAKAIGELAQGADEPQKKLVALIKALASMKDAQAIFNNKTLESLELTQEEIEQKKNIIKLQSELNAVMSQTSVALIDFYKVLGGRDELEIAKQINSVERRNAQEKLEVAQKEYELLTRSGIARKEKLEQKIQSDILGAEKQLTKQENNPDAVKARGGNADAVKAATEARNKLIDSLAEYESELSKVQSKSVDEFVFQTDEIRQAINNIKIGREELQQVELRGKARILELEYQRIDALNKFNREQIVTGLEMKKTAEDFKDSLKQSVDPLSALKERQLIEEQIAQANINALKDEQKLQRERLKDAARTEYNELSKMKGRTPSQSARLSELSRELAYNVVSDTESIKNLSKDIIKAEQQLGNLRMKNAADFINQLRQTASTMFSLSTSFAQTARETKDNVRSLYESQQNLANSVASKINEAADAVRGKREQLSSAIDGLRSARQTLFEALRSAADNTTNYGLAVAKANVAAEKVLGTFYGLEDEANALKGAYDSVIASAQAAGASEQKLAEIRAESVKEQLQLFENLLSEQRSKAQQFFTSSAEDRINFVQGLAGIQKIVGQFGGNIENFRGLSESELNQFGASLISLPQELRQNIAGALDQLPNGVGIGGLTADQITEVLQGGAFGKSQELGIESISEDIKIVADLTRQAAEIDQASFIQDREAINQARAGLEQAKENVLIAKLQLAQAQDDALKIQRSVGEVVSTLDEQVGSYRTEYQAGVRDIVNSNKTREEKTLLLGQLLNKFTADVKSSFDKISSFVGAVTKDNNVLQRSGPVPLGGAQGEGILSNILSEMNKNSENFSNSLLKFSEAGNNFVTGLGSVTAQLNSIANKLGTKGTEIQSAIIKIDNKQDINVYGLDDTVNQALQVLRDQDLFTPQQSFDYLATQFYSIVSELFSQGIIKGGFR